MTINHFILELFDSYKIQDGDPTPMTSKSKTEFISSLFSIKFEIAEVFAQQSYKSKMTVESGKAFAAGRALSPADLPTLTSVSLAAERGEWVDDQHSDFLLNHGGPSHL